MDDMDLLQMWSYYNGLIVRIVAPDFTFCVVNEYYPQEEDKLKVRSEFHMPGDFRKHYRQARKWQRIA
jgi:hypothetical protein